MTEIIIKYAIELALGIISTGLLAGYKYLYTKQKAVGNGVKALLRDRIIQTCNHYRDKGFCPIYALENIELMHKEYKALGGNGTIDTIVKEMHGFPREREKEVI